MKTLHELETIQNRAKSKFNLSGQAGARIVVGLATCGIAAGARSVLQAFQEEVAARMLSGVEVSLTGCIGVCRLEPIVEVYKPAQPKVTYIRVTPDMAARIVDEHIVGNAVVTEYTIGAAE